MADGVIQVAPDSTGKMVDVSELTVGSNTVERQRVVIGDPTTATSLADVTQPSTAAQATDCGLVVAVSPNSHVPLLDAESTLSGGPVVNPNTVLFTVDTKGYNSIAVQLNGEWVGAVNFVASNDQTTWYPVPGWVTGDDVVPVTSVYEEDLFSASVNKGRYLRAITNSDFNGALGGVSWVAYLRQAQVVAPSGINVFLDPGLPINTGITTPTGARVPLKGDAQGNLAVSDAPPTQVMSGVAVGSIVSFWDTTGYQSVAVQVIVAGGATITYEASNTGADWVLIPGVQVSTLGGGLVQTSTTAVLLHFPAIAKFFRARISTASVLCTVASTLRSQPVSVTNTQVGTNLAAISGTAPVTAGVAGMQAVGGNIAAGTAPTANPVLAGGIDTAGLTRRLLTDPSGAAAVVGLDPIKYPTTNVVQVGGPAPTSTLSNFPIKTSEVLNSPNGMDGMIDAMNRIVMELRQLTTYVKELPLYLNTGTYCQDDDRQFRDDPSIFAN